MSTLLADFLRCDLDSLARAYAGRRASAGQRVSRLRRRVDSGTVLGMDQTRALLEDE